MDWLLLSVCLSLPVSLTLYILDLIFLYSHPPPNRSLNANTLPQSAILLIAPSLRLNISVGIAIPVAYFSWQGIRSPCFVSTNIRI